MTKEVRMMINMADSVTELMGANIDRMDLQCHNSALPDKRWYHLDVWLDNGKEFTIREGCTIWIHEKEEK